MKHLFVNGSPDRDGATARLAAELPSGKSYETLSLHGFHIAC